MNKILVSFKNVNHKLFISLLVMGFVPTVYTTLRVFWLGNLPGEWSYSIAGQLYKADGIWRNFEDGVFTEANGIAQRPDNKQWYYVENGVFKKSTGLAQRLDNGKWYYVEKGVYTKATGAAKRLDNGKWFYVQNGSYTKATGLAKRMDSSDWYYFKSGSYNKYTGKATKIGEDGTEYDVVDGKMMQ